MNNERIDKIADLLVEAIETITPDQDYAPDAKQPVMGAQLIAPLATALVGFEREVRQRRELLHKEKREDAKAQPQSKVVQFAPAPKIPTP